MLLSLPKSDALSLALNEPFYAPLTAMAAQVYAALPDGSRTDLSSIAVAGEHSWSPSMKLRSLSESQSFVPVAPAKVGFVGLGAMGSRMAKGKHCSVRVVLMTDGQCFSGAAYRLPALTSGNLPWSVLHLKVVLQLRVYWTVPQGPKCSFSWSSMRRRLKRFSLIWGV